MPKPKIPNQKKKYSVHQQRIEHYMSLLSQVYSTMNVEAAKLINRIGYNGEKPFRFSDYPQTKATIDKIQTEFASNIQAIIINGVTAEWGESNFVQDELVKKVLSTFGADWRAEKYSKYFNNNADALKSFLARKNKGLNLSQKVWNLSNEYKDGLEAAVSLGAGSGIGAVELSKRISKYLNDFPKLRKDYTAKFGKAIDILDCEYQSARLARTEINMAYRTAEQTRWSQMDLVVGYKVKRSGKSFSCKVCEALAGKYPKGFKFVGWHPNCMCYVIPILKTEDEFWEWDGRSDVTTSSVNEVKDIPDGFKQWINDNIHRAKNWDSTPYFIQDNSKYIREDFKVNVYNKTEKAFVRKRRTNLAMSRVEFYHKTYSNIPEVQQAAINAYTQTVRKENKGATSREINRRLRNETKTDYVDVASELISQGLQKFTPYTGMAYRGETMSMKKLQERFLDRIGDVVLDKGFVSSSLYEDTPRKFISHDGVPKSHKRLIFEIQSKNGRDISKISEFNGIFTLENQYEILFDKRTKFLILPDYKIEDSVYRIKLIEQ